MATPDASNPLKYWSFATQAGDFTTGEFTIGSLYKLKNIEDANSTIVANSIIVGTNYYVTVDNGGNNPNPLHWADIQKVQLFEKVSGRIVAMWDITDFSDNIATFQNNTATNGANWPTWDDFVTAIINFTIQPYA